MVIVEQSLAVAARLAERVVFVEKGAIRFDGAPADLAADEELAKAVFLGGPDRPGTP
jgi:ABC-type branched-subunit amino acid transport system ATPase component